MSFSAENADLVHKTAKFLRQSRIHLRRIKRNGIGFSLPVEPFFLTICDNFLQLRKDHGDQLDMTHYILSTPKTLNISKSVARKFIDNIKSIRYTLDTNTTDLGSLGFILDPTEVCRQRSGMEFFLTAFGDVPVLNLRRTILFKNCIGVNALRDRYTKYDEMLKRWASTYQFFEEDVIPTNIPVDHWWWEMTARDKPKENFDFMGYKAVLKHTKPE